MLRTNVIKFSCQYHYILFSNLHMQKELVYLKGILLWSAIIYGCHFPLANQVKFWQTNVILRYDTNAVGKITNIICAFSQRRFSKRRMCKKAFSSKGLFTVKLK